MAAVTRLGDNSVGGPCSDGIFHGATPSITCSPNVFINAKGVIRIGDTYETHPDSAHPGRALSGGSSTVFVNGKQLGRIGDSIDCGDKVSEGSPDVFAG